ncbi:MAG: hypothetical protein ACK5M4_06670 [Pseudorhodobacter sp.]
MSPALLRLILSFALLTGCASFPDVQRAGAVPSGGSAPDLVPTETLLAMEASPRATEESTAALAARAAGLRARAAGLRNRSVGTP